MSSHNCKRLGQQDAATERKPAQPKLTQFYEKVTEEDHARNTSKAFRLQDKLRKKTKQRQERRHTNQQQLRRHENDRTLGLTTVNVRGLASHMQKLGAKLQGLKEQHQRGQRDITFLEETHLKAEEHEAAGAQFSALWGFKPHTATKFTYWVSGEDRRAGVAILLNPYGAVTDPEPWGSGHWTEHLVMIAPRVGGKEFIFVNIYAPSHPAVRVQLFKKMRNIMFPEDVTVVCGGDFNCVVDRQRDRIGGSSKKDVGAGEFAKFIEHNGMADTGYSNIPGHVSRAEVLNYAHEHHTHRHKAADGSIGTSRLDRWYITATAQKLVQGQTAEESPCAADHRAVLLELHPPRGEIRVAKRPKIYPAPAYVQTATTSMIRARLHVLAVEMETMDTENTATAWDSYKTRMKQDLIKLKKEARQRMNNGFRQRIKRLKQQLDRCGYAEADSEDNRGAILKKIQEAQESRRVQRRRTAVARNTWSSRSSTKHFFRRICTKYGDNTIPTLVGTATHIKRGAHDKADTLADSWVHIFNGAAEKQETIPTYVGRLAKNWQQVDLSDLDENIDEEEVADAINKCKSGKACGPDELGNEWYKDHKDEMVPLLTQVFNNCLEHGTTPASFLEAFIFSISKGGDRGNPLNYRPIALLNTDCKIFTRILAWRVRKYITKLVHETQCGFIPGRTIHEAIDLFEAAKVLCREGGDTGELSEAQVLMLDFAKAYDSLDRTFLLEVLRQKGFPPRFCEIVQAIHNGTTVRFMANGDLSRPIVVTSGIRQGCPLAPLLFIIAVDLLYNEIEETVEIQGIPVGGGTRMKSLKVAGYANDTAIYVAHRRMQQAAIKAVGRFTAVSGLKLNVAKSSAISLGLGRTQHTETPRSVQPTEPTELEEEHEMEVKEMEEVRYLGHIAGPGDNTGTAWKKAFETLTVRLPLAELKTNTVAQRAMIAAAVIVPKLLYVARHAWPTEELVKAEEELRVERVLRGPGRSTQRVGQARASRTTPQKRRNWHTQQHIRVASYERVDGRRVGTIAEHTDTKNWENLTAQRGWRRQASGSDYKTAHVRHRQVQLVHRAEMGGTMDGGMCSSDIRPQDWSAGTQTAHAESTWINDKMDQRRTGGSL